MLDKRKFAEVMTLFSEAVGKTMSSGLLDFYYAALKDMDTDTFTQRATHVFKTRKYTSLPLPGEFLSDGIEDGDRAMAAAEVVLRTMARVGGDEDVDFRDFEGDQRIVATIALMGGWVFCCCQVNDFPVDKLGIWKRDFAAIYKTVGHHPKDGAKMLFGRHSQGNITRGFLNPATGVFRNALGEEFVKPGWGSKQIAAPEKIEPCSLEESQQNILAIKESYGMISEEAEDGV